MAAGALEPCFYKWGRSQPAGVGRRAPRRSSPSASRPGRAAGCRPHGGGAGCQSGALSRLPVPPALPGQCSAPVTLGPQPELHRGLGCPGHFRSIPREGGQLRRSWARPGPEPAGSGGPVRDELLALLPAAALGAPPEACALPPRLHGFARHACSLARALSVCILVGFPEVVFHVKGFAPDRVAVSPSEGQVLGPPCSCQ